MFRGSKTILCRWLPLKGAAAIGLAVLLGACGQKGDLYLPTEPAARDRATLPQTLNPRPAIDSPATPAQNPVTPAPAR